MKSSHNFFRKGILLGLAFLLFAMPVFVFAQGATGGNTLTIGENSFTRQGGENVPNDPSQFTQPYNIIDSFTHTVGSGNTQFTSTYHYVQGRDNPPPTIWMVREDSSALNGNTQTWARLEDAHGSDLGWSRDVANAAGVAGSGFDLAETASFLNVGYQERLAENLNHHNYTIVNSYIDYDAAGDPDFVAIVEWPNGERKVLYHEDMNKDTVFNPNEDSYKLYDPQEILDNPELLSELGFNEELSRDSELRDIALANRAIAEQQTIAEEIASLERDLAEAQAAAAANPTNAQAQAEVSRINADLENARARQQAQQNAIERGGNRRDLTDGNANTSLGQDIKNAVLDPVVKSLLEIWKKLLEMLTWLIIQGSALFVGIAGVALNYTIQELIIEMGAKIAQIDGINIAWTAIRDVINISFIFIMLYISGSIIMQYRDADAKKMLKNVIIIAILINFSLFFTKVVIDVANVLTLSLNNSILQQYQDGSGSGGTFTVDGGVKIQKNGIAGQLMNGLGMGDSFSTKNLGPADDALAAFLKAIIIGIFLCTTALVLLLVAIMLLVRFVILILVLVLSPAAFMGFVLPALKKGITDKWLDALVKNAFFPAIFFLMLTIAFKMMESRVFNVNFNSELSPALGPMVINYIILLGFVVGGLLIAKEIGVHGGSMAVSKLNSAGKWATGTVRKATVATAAGTAGYAYRGSVGRVSNAIANKAGLQNNAVGRFIARGARSAANVGGDRSFTARQEKAKKGFKETHENIGKSYDRKNQYNVAAKKQAEIEKNDLELKRDEARRNGDTVAETQYKRQILLKEDDIKKHKQKVDEVNEEKRGAQQKLTKKLARSRFGLTSTRVSAAREASTEIQKELQKEKEEDQKKKLAENEKKNKKEEQDANREVAKKLKEKELEQRDTSNRIAYADYLRKKKKDDDKAARRAARQSSQNPPNTP